MEVSYVFPKICRKVFQRAAIKGSAVDRTARVDIGSVVAGCTLGRYSYVGEHTTIIETEVGSFSSISNYCAIGGGAHPVEWVSTSPVFNSSKGILKKHFSDTHYEPYARSRIGHDVWIGAHCLIKSGVTVGDGAVIGMGAVVTKDVGPYEIWGGNPAHLIRKRFDEDKIQKLLEIKWWEWPEEKIRRNANLFCDLEEFLEVSGR